MTRIAKVMHALTLAIAVGVPIAAAAHDGAGHGARTDRPAAQAARPAIDPFIQAILIAAAAGALREAAASPDPVATLADSLERKLLVALSSPEAARLAERLVAEAVKDAPQELREPLAQFAAALLDNFRRELTDRRSRSSRVY